MNCKITVSIINKGRLTSVGCKGRNKDKEGNIKVDSTIEVAAMTVLSAK